MLILTQQFPPDPHVEVDCILPLTAEERTRSRYKFTTGTGEVLHLQLPRGTLLQDGDLLSTDSGIPQVRIIAKAEPVFTVGAGTPLDLLKAAYHLGNRHIPLEITETYLRLSPDEVLKKMLTQMGLTITEETTPFHPEMGAYHHH